MADAEVWRVEFHVLDKDGDAVDYLGSKAEAIAKATEIGGSVEKVTSFLDDRETVFTAKQEDDDGEG